MQDINNILKEIQSQDDRSVEDYFSIEWDHNNYSNNLHEIIIRNSMGYSTDIISAPTREECMHDLLINYHIEF